MHRLLIAFSVAALMAGFSAQAEAQQSAGPEGIWLGGGFDQLAGGGVGSMSGFRIEGGIPLGDLPISIVLPFTFHGRNYGFGSYRMITIAPGINYEYRLDQIDMPGLLSIYGDAQLGFFALFDNFDDRFTGNDTFLGGVLRMNVGARYYMEKPRGLFFNLSPVGFSAFMRNGGWASYEFLAGVGWRFE